MLPARRRATIAILFAAGLSLAGCSQAPTTSSANDGADATASTSEASPSAGVASTPEPASTPVEAANAAPAQSSGPLACSAEIGAAAAQTLVDQCVNVSPATHPPCNVANSCAMIRSEIARGCALLDEKAEGVDGCITPIRGALAASETIRRYYSAINARDFNTAYATWSGDGQASGKSAAAFADGYAHTRRVNVDIGKPGGGDAGAGSVYINVPVTIDAVLDDGTRQQFRGTYTLRQINGPNGPGPSQGWHIATADLKKTS